ncbi:MAG: hypothetical protein WC224_04370 [Sphaerochaetaceae bacterium]
MKKVFILMAFILIIALPLMAANPVRANGFGAGIALGYPSGVTVRYGMDNFRFFGTVGNHYGADVSLDLGALYDIVSFDIGGLPLYLNAGAQLGVGLGFGGGDLVFGMSAAGVVGVSYYLDKQPVEFFLNVAPGYRFLGGSGFAISSNLGGIWYFN